MKDTEWRERLSAYRDGEVSAEERTEVERWLAADPAARAELDRLTALSRALGRWEVDAPEAAAARGTSLRAVWVAAAIAAVGLAALLLSGGIGWNGPHGPGMAPQMTERPTAAPSATSLTTPTSVAWEPETCLLAMAEPLPRPTPAPSVTPVAATPRPTPEVRPLWARPDDAGAGIQ